MSFSQPDPKNPEVRNERGIIPAWEDFSWVLRKKEGLLSGPANQENAYDFLSLKKKKKQTNESILFWGSLVEKGFINYKSSIVLSLEKK